jgi:hypothetical protein
MFFAIAGPEGPTIKRNSQGREKKLLYCHLKMSTNQLYIRIVVWPVFRSRGIRY